MESMMTSQTVPASFFFYSPDPNAENRQHAHFVQHPGGQQMQPFPAVPTLPSTPLYSRPSSSSGPQPNNTKAVTSVPSNLTPMASPRPVNQKPTIVLETDLCGAEGSYFPSTPPLSSAGSVISSPGSCEVLATPLNPMFSGLDGFEGVKDVSDADSQPERFPNLDWSSCASPPIKPVYLQSQHQQLGEIVSLHANNIARSDLLSTNSCPSLSPSPSPYARSVASEQDVDFCDPRNLTVGTANSTLAPEFPALPTLCPGDEEHKLDLKGDCFKAGALASSQNTFNFTPEIPHGLPTFDDLSDLESEDDFVNGLVNLGEQPNILATRSRASSDAISLSQGSYVCEDDLEGFEDSEEFGFDGLPTPADSASEGDSHRDKRQKTETPEAGPMMNTAADSQSGKAEQRSGSQGDNGSEDKTNSGSSTTSEAAPSAPLPAPANRRGRKQSLTEDPSKTFVCDLCNRRFRRQEHLKRHYRSLHTHEKPFECQECGKKFSRSDNLAQHARTHGSGAIIMNLIDDPEAAAAAAAAGYPPPMMAAGHPEDYHNLGKVLFQVAADVPGSASELSSEEGSDSQGKKKRKRAD